tara:strand:- start:24 stop:365 length:342 start_codon:yes stop_codon:yes gene_type:complete
MNEGFDESAEPLPLACSVISARVEPGQLVTRRKGVRYGDSTFSALENIVGFAILWDILQNGSSSFFSAECTNRPRNFFVLFHELAYDFEKGTNAQWYRLIGSTEPNKYTLKYQ